jgi:hypothetical protein
MDFTGLTGEVIYKYGTYIFIFWVATFLIRKMWGLFEGRIKDIDNNVIENMKINTENKKTNKDILVIQAQISEKQSKIADKLTEHDVYDRKFREKELTFFEKICDFLNGGNPALKKIQQEIDEMKEDFKRNNEK